MRKLGKQSWEMLIAGTLSGVAWAPISWWPLGLLGWAWWMIAVSRGHQQAVFVKSLLFTMTSWLIAFHWLAFHPITVAAFTSVVALLAFSCLFSAITAIVVTAFPEQRQAYRLAAALLSLLMFEIAVSWGPFAMPSLSAGFAFTPSKWALNVSSWVGIKGVSAAVGLWGASAAWLVLRTGRYSKVSTTVAVFTLLALTFLPWSPTGSAIKEMDLDLSVQIIQPNASPEAWSDIHDEGRIERFIDLLHRTQLAPEDVHLTVFPETALPIGDEVQIRRWIQKMAEAASSPVLSGGIEISSRMRARNVAFLSSDSIAHHAKVRLVPFAEYVPFSNHIPGFERFAVPSGGVDGYEPGKTRSLLSLPIDPVRNEIQGISLVPLICFESLFLRDARSGLLEGGDVSVVITQDGWWSSDRARSQHLAFSQMLAAATGHPVIHGTVDGESALIDAFGRLRALEAISPSVLRGQLPMASKTTGFMRAGNAPFFGIFGALAALLTAARFQFLAQSSSRFTA